MCKHAFAHLALCTLAHETSVSAWGTSATRPTFPESFTEDEGDSLDVQSVTMQNGRTAVKSVCVACGIR